VYCENEIFFMSPRRDRLFLSFVDSVPFGRARYLLRRGQLVAEFLDRFYLGSGQQAIGFKYMYGQARRLPRRFPSVVDYVRDNQITVIHNIRNNYLAVQVSRVLARQTGIYHSENPVQARQIDLHATALPGQLRKLRDQDLDWKNRMYNVPYLRVNYEDLVADQRRESERILEFLGVTGVCELKTSLRKVAPRQLSEAIRNYAEVRSVLIGTEFEYCLDEYREDSD
jgi:hypothetical protein